jgi:hypothetical protein
MDKITGVLNALQGIYGKGFVLAGLLPICLLLGVCWLLGCCLSPGFVEFTEYLLSAKLLQQFAIGTLTLFLVSLISFVFWQLNTWFLRTFEGRVLPRIIQDFLSAGERNSCGKLDREIAQYQSEAFDFRKAKATWEGELVALSTGAGNTILNSQLDGNYNGLRAKAEGWQMIPFSEFKAFHDQLATELMRTSINQVPRLEELRDELCGPLLRTGCALAERDLYRRVEERKSCYPADQMSIGPSRLANVQAAQRADLMQSYGIDIGVFWSSLQKIAAADEKFAAILENAKTRLDFSVALAAVSAIFLLAWLLLYGLIGSSWIIFFTGAIAAAIVAVVTRQLVVLTYQSFAETVRTTVELFRFDLLKAMHISLPLDSDAEKETWKWLAQSVQVGNQVKVIYA